MVGLADPNPVACGGACQLREAGLEVVEGVCAQECRDLVADFLVWQTQNRPYVILKMAATLDGRIATRKGQSQWISSEPSRQEVQRLRAGIGLCGGAVLIGGGTFRADDPRLTVHEAGATAPQPLACVLTSRLPQPDADFHLLRHRPEQTIFMASPAAAASTTAKALREMGVRVLALGPRARGGGPDFVGLLQLLWQDCTALRTLRRGRQAGAEPAEAGMVDDFRLHLAPIILGDADAHPLFSGPCAPEPGRGPAPACKPHGHLRRGRAHPAASPGHAARLSARAASLCRWAHRAHAYAKKVFER